MRTYLIVIRDIVSDSHSQPEMTAHLASAIRAFEDRCAGKLQQHPQQDVVYLHPEHFELWVIGEYGDGDAKLTEYTDARRQLAAGANYVNKA